MSKGKYKDADLILKLYDLRREKTMREARDWFFTFNPQSPQDFMNVMTSDKSAYYRMVVSYWEMACSLVNHGAIDADMFGDANGEHMFVYSKLEPFLPALREAMGSEKMLSNLEQVVKDTPDYKEKLEMIRDRMAKFAELMKQKDTGHAAAASN